MKLRAARDLSGMTQEQIAKKAHISKTHYQYIEYNQKEPGVRTAIRIARALKTTVEKIFSD